MRDCIVCIAYPDHRGTHYSSHDAVQMLSAERGHSPGLVQWTPFPGVLSAEGNRILVTTHNATEGEAHPVEGLWLLEQSKELVAKPEYSGLPAQRTRPLHLSPEAGEEDVPQPQGGGASLYVNWSNDGLRVEVNAVLGTKAQQDIEKLNADLRDFWTEDGVKATLMGARSENEVRIARVASRGRQARLCVTLGNLLDLLTRKRDPDRVVVSQAA